MTAMREAALALGASTTLTWSVALAPELRSILLRAFFSAVARTVGSTAAIVMIEQACKTEPQTLPTALFAGAGLPVALALLAICIFGDWLSGATLLDAQGADAGRSIRKV
jgi:ABC-type phosphate transport system permease subunit